MSTMNIEERDDGRPLVLISTAEDPVPVILERPEWHPFDEGERALWRPATEDEYARYFQLLHGLGGRA